ncbi:TniQ family protein [Hydrogenophaga sp.]|uniref:TniQ family protein n=1 Tax=Hydrogenophaga sp. TaxID=1904254 RepID=UPI0027331296|nr:hypothetical protein [Hydrogenophaga sp.]MDP3108685.1 hypothetical protein [Hydrogenophaga sp.]
MQLAITLTPDDNESPLGYYRRLACENALWNWKELARMAGVSPTRTGLLSQPDYMAETLQLQPSWTHALAQREATARSWRALHRFGHDAVCPTCLTESAYLRQHWEHGYSVACHRHAKHLIDRCPACGDFLSHDRERIELCQCGHDLRSVTAENASSAQLWLASLLAGEYAGNAEVAPNLEGVSVNELAQLVRLLCQQADVSVAGPRRNAASPRAVQEAIEFLRPLDDLLQDWPHRFESHVSERIAAANPDARTLNSALGRWYQQLKKLGATGPLQVFLKSVIQVAAREFDGVIDHVAAAELGEDSHVPVATVAKSLGLGRDALVQHLKSGGAVYRTRRLGTSGFCYEVPTEEVERLLAERRRWTTREDASRTLGVGPSVLENLCEVSLLTADASWRTQLLKGGPVLEESVIAFETAVRAHLKKTKTSESCVALRELTSRRVGEKKALQSVLRAIGSGELSAVAGGDKVGSFRFRVSDVKRYFGRPVLESGLSVNQLAKVTGWKWESIRHWIDTGFMDSHEIVLRGQPCRVVMPEQLLAFSQTYVPLSTLAHSLDSKSSALLERLGGIGLVGGKLLPGGATRGALVRMSDLAAAALRPGL